MKRDLYAEVSARIIAELEAGAAPWILPCFGCYPSGSSGGRMPTGRIRSRSPQRSMWPRALRYRISRCACRAPIEAPGRRRPDSFRSVRLISLSPCARPGP
jgi:hypothetical protein